ncbi:MAG: hypothetical protein K2N51_17285, partial [Lachnospiraceae bacterium]|nr:hypothetical protein [Lachnospiraceae bacterium]
DSNGNTINYSYNQMGCLDTMTYPNGKEVSYTYYDNGKLKSVTDGENQTTTYEYDQNGRVTAQHNSNGTTDTYEYDKAGQLIKQQVVKGTKVLTETSYTYDEAGNITGKTTSEPEGSIGTIEPVEMTYDKANRLTTYNGEEVTYDAEGNMTYGPDAEGNMTTFHYNCRNQLIQAGKVKYEYDAEGNRSAQVNTETGVRTEYVTDTVNQLSQVLMATETGGGNTESTIYTYGNGLLSQRNREGYSTFHYNNIGSTILLTNAQGEKEETYSYGPYGELLSGDRSKTPYLYNGMYGVTTDANGLYYMRARYYNVAIKRFINQDVVDGSITNSQSLNKFSYVQGNPIRLTDPFGLCPDISLTRIGHAALDLLGIIPGFDGCDGINAVWYLIEGDYANAATSAVAAFPLLGSLIGSGIKWGAKGVANAEKIADGIKTGSRIIGNAGALIQSGGQTLESAGNLYDSYVKDGEVISWKNATDLITLGLSVAGMGMAGKSLAKDGKALKAVSQGNVNVKPAAVSNSTASGGGELYPLYRKKKNVGVFSKLKEPMTMENVKMVCQDGGIDYSGIKIKIVDDPELIKYRFLGYTHPGGDIVELYPNAFKNKETLVKTLGHERIHVMQNKLYGPPQDSKTCGLFEDAATDSENVWWEYYKKVNGGD